MSYRFQHGSAGVGSIDMGTRASADPFLASASLEASNVMLAMAKVPAVRRLAVMSDELKKRRVDPDEVARQMKALLAKGSSLDQAAFDAMRLSFANDMMTQAKSKLRDAAAKVYGWDAVIDSSLEGASLGDASTDQALCMAAATSVAVAEPINAIPVAGGIASGVLNIFGNVTSGAVHCTAGTVAAQQQLAAAQAQAAAKQAALAQQVAASQSQHRQSQIRIAAIGGGILLTVLAVGWLLD